MSELPGETTRLLDLHRNGDPGARDELIRRHSDRLRHLTKKMLRRYPGVRRWEETDDVCQKALLRLWQTLGKFRPESSLHYCRLARKHITRTLIDLARHHQGPEGQGANHHTDRRRRADDAGGSVEQRALDTEEPSSLAQWGEFYGLVESLPEEERDVFGLLWFQGMSQEEAAEVLGVPPRTVRRRWQDARLRLRKLMRQSPVF